MSEIALYRKYRPETFDHVLGQDTVVSILKKAVSDSALSHAYLFSGSRGTGKTSVARIVANEIGTTENDLHEIDAASNRGIDDIRALRESIQTLPYESKYKVYIIDEVHMLTKEAFNALLKTLEEPPQHALFILATTEISRLPDTIVSRCEVHHFKKPGQKIIADMVEQVSKKEGFTIDRPSAELVALLGDGSFRDALGVLQKVIRSSEDKKLTQDEVEKITGAPQGKRINEFISSIEGRDLSKGLLILHESEERDTNIEVFFKLFLHKLRLVLLLRYAPELKKEIEEETSEEDFKFLMGIAENKESKITTGVLRRFLEASHFLGRSTIPHLPLELALVDLLETDL